jgi:hypothetical protein
MRDLAGLGAERGLRSKVKGGAWEEVECFESGWRHSGEGVRGRSGVVFDFAARNWRRDA